MSLYLWVLTMSEWNVGSLSVSDVPLGGGMPVVGRQCLWGARVCGKPLLYAQLDCEAKTALKIKYFKKEKKKIRIIYLLFVLEL